jgi:hypothetical protein
MVVLPVIAGLVVLALVGVFFVLPIVLESRCVAAAAERGVTLTIDHVDIGLGDVRLVKPAFVLSGVPQISAHADDAQVVFSGLSPVNTTIHNLTLTVDGPMKEVDGALGAWKAKLGAPQASAGRTVAFSPGHLVWTRAMGDSAKLETVDAEGQFDLSANAVHLTAEHVTLSSNQTTLGPWRTTFETDAQQTRTDIELDPVMHGGPAVVYLRTAAGAVSVTVSVPGSPLSHIGIPPKEVKLGSDPQLEAKVAFTETPAGAATLDATMSLSKAVFAGTPVDAMLKLQGAGDVAKGLDIKTGSLQAGPLNATVSGTMNVYDDGVRLALAWTAHPIPCSQMAKQIAARALGPLGAIAGDVGDLVGFRVTGEARASGLMTFDTRDANPASSTLTSNDTCGLALF